MQEKPFHKITIKEICERADLNRTTFYLHYTDQTQLLNEIISLLENDMYKCIISTDGEGDGIDRLTKYLEFVKDNSAVYSTLMRSDDDGGARTRIITDILSDIKHTMPVFGNQTENRYVYRFVIDGSVSMILGWIDSGFDLSTTDLARLIFRLGSVIDDKIEQIN